MSKFKGLRCIDVLQCLGFSLKKEELELVCVTLWGLWWNRNQVVHNGKPRSGQNVLEWTVSILSEFQNMNAALKSTATLPPNRTPHIWNPPPSGVLKLNTDVALRPGLGVIGLGAVIRRSDGSPCVALSKPMKGFFSAEVGEILALREGLLLAKSHGLQVQQVEIDATSVAALLGDVSYMGVAANILNDVRVLCEDVGFVNCRAVPRLGNRLAHSLASLACSFDKEKIWKNSLPSCISVV